MNANTIPLQEVLPWSPNVPRNILVCDSIETDGTFVLSTMVSHLFSSSSLSSSLSVPSSFSPGPRGPNHLRQQQQQRQRQQRSSRKALWLSGNGSTERQVASTLKKMGCDAGAAYLRNNNNNNSNSNSIQQTQNGGLRIRSLAVEISDQILANKEFDGERYLKSVYKDIKAWINDDDGGDDDNDNGDGNDLTVHDTSWIILDDATALASMLGDTLVYCFVESLIHLVGRKQPTSRTGTRTRTPTRQRQRKFGLIVRCSGDVDQMLHKVRGNNNNSKNEGKNDSELLVVGWVGAGGMAHKQAVDDAIHRTLVPWERALEESVDAIVDVLPLLSGFSREAHGRLIFSETPNGRGWRNRGGNTTTSTGGGGGGGANANASAFSVSASASGRHTTAKTIGASANWNKLIFNYRIQDTGARAIRLRAS